MSMPELGLDGARRLIRPPSGARDCRYITDVAVAIVAVRCILGCLTRLEAMHSALRPDMRAMLIPDLRWGTRVQFG